MKINVYTHRIDCDGICSAAILKRYLEKENLEGRIDFINYDPVGELTQTFSGIGELDGDSTVIIADFGYNSLVETLAEAAFKKLKSKGGKIVWLDHHKWEDSGKQKLSDFAKIRLSRSDEFCGAELSYLEYMKDENISEALAKLGRDADLEMWKTNPPSATYALTLPVENLITYYNYLGGKDMEKRRQLLLGLVDKLSKASLQQILNKDFKQPLWDKELKRDWEKYRELEVSKLEECLLNSETFKVGTYNCAVGLADDIISSTLACRSLLNKYNTQIAFVFYQDGRLSVRRDDSRKDIKCNEIAKLFNGGGHEYAAGGNAGIEIKNTEDIAKVKELIRSRFSDKYK
jgi:oligoribonuclease NrnB/cAMP/cGMP phosphodiesterase (DHH superfamily)